jgi:putative heme-binding domain-containing protein
VVAALKALLGKSPAPDVRREAVIALAALDMPAAVPEIISTLKATTAESDAQAFWRALLGIRGAAGRLANELPKANLPKEIARAGLRPAREGNQNQALVTALLKASGLTVSNVQLTPAELQALAQEALAKGNAARGEQFYRRADLACMACHSIGGAGGKVGPDLTSIGASAQPDYLVESLLYPSAKIKEGYHSVTLTTKDNQEFSGMIVKETENEIVLRDAANAEKSIAVKNLARRVNIGSLMPAGLTDSLLPEERLDLVKFLSSLGKPGDFDASKGGVARAWKLYLIQSPNEHLGVERVVKADFTLKDWKSVYSLVSGRIAKEIVDDVLPNRGNNRGLFAATQFQSAKGAPARFTLAGAAKGVWVNGVALKPAAEFTAETKSGLNTIVVQLDDTKLESPVKLGSGDVTFLVE